MIKDFFQNIKRRHEERNAEYRILETRSIFIPQIYGFAWEGIDREDNSVWTSFDIQLTRCSHKTFGAANERLQNYLTYLDSKKNHEKEIVHLVKKDPSFWRILKNKEIE